MKSRITRHVARIVAGLALLVATYFGVESISRPEIMPIAITIASGLVGLGGMAVNHVAKKLEDGEKKGRNTPAMWLLALVPCLSLAGCASNPVDDYYQSRSNVTEVKEQAVNAHKAGWISDREFVALSSYARAATDALASWKAVLPTDEQGNLDPDGELPDQQAARFYSELVQQSLRKLQRYLQEQQDEPGHSASIHHRGDRSRPIPGRGDRHPNRPERAGWAIHPAAA